MLHREREHQRAAANVAQPLVPKEDLNLNVGGNWPARLLCHSDSTPLVHLLIMVLTTSRLAANDGLILCPRVALNEHQFTILADCTRSFAKIRPARFELRGCEPWSPDGSSDADGSSSRSFVLGEWGFIPAVPRQYCATAISLRLASPFGSLPGDASGDHDTACGPIGAGNASGSPARDPCPAASTRRPHSFE
jgi:hypothetical protein